uniref:NADPH:quinone reductase n=1 Tax=uncultured haloarchaeon TaxID=160804 RepID=A5YSY3_9EURY|nr:NADPH:quinone reductase [uncultured haloarchaeon]
MCRQFISGNMEAVQFAAHGDRDVIEYGEFPNPTIERDEVLVDVKAASVNHLDVWTRRGLPGIDVEMPHIPGSDMAGVVSETGADVTRFDPGNHVALIAGVAGDTDEFTRKGDPTLAADYHLIGEHVRGVHSEYTAVPAANLVPVPDHVPWEIAGSTSLVFQTAWRMLIDRAELRTGEHVLIHGASGGVGHAAVQIASHAGATVSATASTERKLEHAADYGAEHLINYENTSFADEIYQITDGRGVDIVIDHVGEATYEGSLKSLRKGGRLITCGATTGPNPDANLNRIFWNQLQIIGSTMATPGQAEEVLDLVWDGTLKPHIRETLPMSDIAHAHELLENREGFGKVVVIPDNEY